MLNRCFVLQTFRIAKNTGITFSMLKQENGNYRKEMKSVFFDVGVRETADAKNDSKKILNGTATSNSTVIELGPHKSKQKSGYKKCIEQREAGFRKYSKSCPVKYGGNIDRL